MLGGLPPRSVMVRYDVPQKGGIVGLPHQRPVNGGKTQHFFAETAAARGNGLSLPHARGADILPLYDSFLAIQNPEHFVMEAAVVRSWCIAFEAHRTSGQSMRVRSSTSFTK